MKFYILKDEKKFYLDGIQDGFINIKDENNNKDKIDLAIVKKVYKENDNQVDEISITQYLIMSNQLKDGNEWEINKWMIYLFFSSICSIINGAFSFVGFTLTLYTIPLFLISTFCCWQLNKIKHKKKALILFILSILVLFFGAFGELFFMNYHRFFM